MTFVGVSESVIDHRQGIDACATGIERIALEWRQARAAAHLASRMMARHGWNNAISAGSAARQEFATECRSRMREFAAPSVT